MSTDRKRRRRPARPSDRTPPGSAGLIDGLFAPEAARLAELATADRRLRARLEALRETERRFDAARDAVQTFTPPRPPWWRGAAPRPAGRGRPDR